MPDATSVFGYNRYMYGFGNPLKYNDPTGHCVNSTTTNKDVEITYDNDECWRIANTIGAMWDDTDYWRTRFTSPEVFFNSVANNAHNGTDFFQGQLTNFLHSEEGAAWNAQQLLQHGNNPVVDPGNDLNLQAFDAYCSAHDCDGILIDSIGTLSAVGVAAVCIPGFAICGAVATVGTGIGIATGGVSVVRTAALLSENNATQEDLIVSTATFVVGSIGPFGKPLGNMTTALVGLGSATTQMVWDLLGSAPNAERYPPYNE